MDISAMGRRIKHAREQAHMTQAGLAEQVGISVHYISAIERGIKSIKLETFVSIAKALNVSADWLLQSDLGNTESACANEFAAVISVLPSDMRSRILKAIRAFAED